MEVRDVAARAARSLGTTLILLAGVFLFAACSQVPVTPTDRPNQFVVVERLSGPFATLSKARAGAIARAVEHCKSLGKKYVENYSVDRPRSFGQFPEAMLYFTCTD